MFRDCNGLHFAYCYSHSLLLRGGEEMVREGLEEIGKGRDEKGGEGEELGEGKGKRK